MDNKQLTIALIVIAYIGIVAILLAIYTHSGAAVAAWTAPGTTFLIAYLIPRQTLQRIADHAIDRMTGTDPPTPSRWRLGRRRGPEVGVAGESGVDRHHRAMMSALTGACAVKTCRRLRADGRDSVAVLRHAGCDSSDY